jgi:hypothetical protein
VPGGLARSRDSNFASTSSQFISRALRQGIPLQ